MNRARNRKLSAARTSTRLRSAPVGARETSCVRTAPGHRKRKAPSARTRNQGTSAAAGVLPDSLACALMAAGRPACPTGPVGLFKIHLARVICLPAPMTSSPTTRAVVPRTRIVVTRLKSPFAPAPRPRAIAPEIRARFVAPPVSRRQARAFTRAPGTATRFHKELSAGARAIGQSERSRERPRQHQEQDHDDGKLIDAGGPDTGIAERANQGRRHPTRHERLVEGYTKLSFLGQEDEGHEWD
jgi:hypothetical protein